MKLSLYFNRLDTFIDFKVKIPRGWDLLCALRTVLFRTLRNRTGLFTNSKRENKIKLY